MHYSVAEAFVRLPLLALFRPRPAGVSSLSRMSEAVVTQALYEVADSKEA